MTVPHSCDVTTTISCVPKMADNVCELERNRHTNIRLMSENGEFMSVNSEKEVVDNSLNDLKSIFYLNNLQDNCFSKYSVNDDGVNRASEFCPHVDGFSSEYKGICPNNDENCRKKRCSDRYDSSESSDSGIAVSSSASSGTSDITDPGSPFSTSSDDSSSSPGKCKKRCKSEEKSPSWPETSERCRSEEKTWTQTWETKQQSDKTDRHFITPETDFKMAPNVPSATSPCDMWTSMTENNTANDTARFNHFNSTQSEAISNKRLKVDVEESISPLNINNNVVNGVSNVPSPIRSEIENELDKEKEKKKTIGEKAKRRASCDSSSGKNGIKTCDKSVGCVAKPKQDRNRHQNKITEYFKSQIKSLAGIKRDFGYLKKDTFQNGQKTKPLPVPSKPEEPTAKKTKSEAELRSEAPVFVKPAALPLTDASRPLSIPKLKTPDFLLKKPAETKTLFNKILQNHKNRKLVESYMKCRTAATAPAAAAAPAPATATVGYSHKPYETSTRSNLLETPKISTKVEELSSNLQEKVQTKQLDSNLLNVDSKVTDVTDITDVTDVVNCQVVISNRTEPEQSDSSSSTPILSAPKTIRFPASCHNNLLDKHLVNRETVSCRWDACHVKFDSTSGLLDHLQSAHVLTQVSGEKFVCLWVGCKVFDQKSCSRSWLERHVLSHAGNKPYRCIVDGCGQGFSSQVILERHVNNHFAADVKKALDSSLAHKLFRRNGKKLRYRRQPWSARMFDYFDSGIMEGLEHRLVKLTKARTGGEVAETPGKSLALTSQVVARRMTGDGRHQFLLRWYPTDIIEDEWVFEKEVTRKRTVSIPSLSPAGSSTLQHTLELASRTSQPSGASKRKNRGVRQCRNLQEDTCQSAESTEFSECTDSVESFESAETSYSFEPVEFVSLGEENDLKEETPEEPPPPPPKKKVPDKVKAKPKPKMKQKPKRKKNESNCSSQINPSSLPSVSIPVVDISKSIEKTVSLKPKEEEPPAVTPEEMAEMSVVPVCPPAEDMVPVQTGGILVDSSKLMAPLLGSPVKLVASQYIEQPYVQTMMPVQMPVTYQIPIVKLSQPSGMFFPQMHNYIVPQSPPVFPPSPVSAFRNGFHLSTTGTIQIQTSTTTLHQTASNFMQSTNTSGFQILQSPATLQQSILTAFHNSGMMKSPTLRLLNCQPLILNNAKPPMANMSMTLANVSSITNASTSALTMPTVALPPDSNQPPRKIISATKKMVKQKLNILPKPNISQKTGVSDGTKSKKQCLQPCGPTTRAAT